MVATELTADEHRVLTAVQTLHQRGRPPAMHTIAQLVGSTFRPTRRVINRLLERGLITASLSLTEQGAAAAASGTGQQAASSPR